MPYIGENLAMIFGGKGDDQALVEAMKEKFKLVKKLRGYSITHFSKGCNVICEFRGSSSLHDGLLVL